MKKLHTSSLKLIKPTYKAAALWIAQELQKLIQKNSEIERLCWLANTKRHILHQGLELIENDFTNAFVKADNPKETWWWSHGCRHPSPLRNLIIHRRLQKWFFFCGTRMHGMIEAGVRHIMSYSVRTVTIHYF